jgi:predicted nuclease of predicted toxin-antitoxin system
VDGSCDSAIARALVAAGHDVRSIAQVVPGADDATVIELAMRESRTLLTEDKDFGQLVFASAAASPGVVLIRFPARARKAMTHAVMTLVSTYGDRLGSECASGSRVALVVESQSLSIGLA